MKALRLLVGGIALCLLVIGLSLSGLRTTLAAYGDGTYNSQVNYGEVSAAPSAAPAASTTPSTQGNNLPQTGLDLLYYFLVALGCLGLAYVLYRKGIKREDSES